MKNLFCLLFMLLSIRHVTEAQIAYYTAKEISERYVIADGNSFRLKNDSTSVRRIAELLLPHLPDSLQNMPLTRDQIFGLYSRNPFLGSQVSSLIGGAGVNVTKVLSKGVSALGGLDVTAIADGLAQFLIKRGKEELNIAFFQRMKKFLDENIEAKTLFPATSLFLSNIASYRYAELLQSLREAFHRDLKNLLVNLNLLIDLPKYQELLAALPEIRVAVRSAKIVSDLSQPEESAHPANLIHHLAYLNEWHEMDTNLENSWKLLDIISGSVRKQHYELETIVDPKGNLLLTGRELNEDSTIVDTAQVAKNFYQLHKTKIAKGSIAIDSLYEPVSRTDTVFNKEIAWIKYISFHEDILRHQVALRIYLGLLYEEVHSISFRVHDTTVRVQDYLRQHVNDIFTVADLVENFLLLANDVEQSVKDLNVNINSLTNEDYYSYIDKAINIVEYAFKVANAIRPGVSADRYILLARNANNLYKNVFTKNYNAAIMNTYLILDEILGKSKIAIEEKRRFLNADGSGMARNSFLRSDSTLTNTNFFSGEVERVRTVEKILKYGNLMAGIVKSETPEEAESAIEAAALPAGSSSIKKNSDFNISLNAYIGGYYTNHTNDIDKIDGSNSKIGVTAPVGIAFSKGLGRFRNGSSIGALSAYITLLDVGGIAGYRLSNDSTALEQKITLENIFSPGGYLVYGIGLPFLEYVPLSIGYGWQYGSKLYFKRQTGTLGVSDKSRWRANWFVAIDIPLANFWTKAANHNR